MGKLDRLALEAVHSMQLNTTEAIEFIRKQCPKATPEQAQEAITATLTWYKK